MSDQLNLRNIEPTIEQKLRTVGITGKATLLKMGAEKAYQLLIAAGHEPDLELYWRLIGAVEDLDWQIIADREKRRHGKDIDFDA